MHAIEKVIKRATWLNKYELAKQQEWYLYFITNASPCFEPAKDLVDLADEPYLDEKQWGQYSQDITLDTMLEIAQIIAKNKLSTESSKKNYNVVIVGCPGGPANIINLCRRIHNLIWSKDAIRVTFDIYDICKEKCNEGINILIITL